MYTFIVNPNARSGLGKKVWNELENILKEKKVPYEVFFTKYQTQATAITSEITSDGEEHTIVALGGDGTVNEIVNGIQNFEKTTFGYIPIGSSNDFARGLKLPTDPKEALRNILSCPHIQEMNVGESCYKNKKRRFSVSSGIGFDAAICHEAVVSPIKRTLNKLKLGKLTYVFIAIHSLFATKPCTATVTFDNEKEKTFQGTYFVTAMNVKYEGGGVKFCPNAKIDDNKLDVIVISNMPKLKALCLIPLALFGLHTRFKGVYIHRCRKVNVQIENPSPVHVDGEPIFLQRNITFRCMKEKLHVITPKPL